MSDFAHFEIEAQANGKSRVVVNGADVSEDIRGYELRAQHGMPPVLVLYHLAAAGPIEGDGIVQVVGDDGMDQRQAVLSFLDNLDGEQLEGDALDGMAMSAEGPTSAGAAFIEALRKAASA